MPAVARRVNTGQTVNTSPSRRGGLFITFEGIEGSGKSTQCRVLAKYLRTTGFRVVETREPGGTPVAEHIRKLFLQNQKNTEDSLTSETEAALMFSARGQHITSLLRPALEGGAIVLCDRFSDSTLAYQGYGRGLPIPDLRKFNRFVTQGLTPDITLLFDLPVRQGLERRRRAPNQNRIDREAIAFHSRVRQGFLKLARIHPRRITLVNAQRLEETISKDIRKLVEPIIQRRLKSQQIVLA